MELEKQDEISGDEIVDEEIILSPTEIIANIKCCFFIYTAPLIKNNEIRFRAKMIS